ncbi:MAG: hypothetical protein ACOYOK_15805 [Pseudobdellovibrionaceae bacterium]
MNPNELKKSQFEILLDHTKDFYPFQSEEGVSFCEITQDNIKLNLSTEEQTFRKAILDRYYAYTKSLPDDKCLDKFIQYISYQGSKNPREKIHIRIGKYENEIYYDLGNDQFVKITKDGWFLVNQSPIRFVRAGTMKANCTPQMGGNIQLLKQFLNIESEESFIILICYLLGTLWPSKQYPLAIFQGPQGSAKSTATEIIKSLLDPATPSLRSLPYKEQDIFIACSKTHLVCYDNLSGIKPALSDALCKIATGCGISGRKLYTNADEYFIEVSRPMIINGIDNLTDRQDLADRAVVLNFPKLAGESRRSSTELFKEFEETKPLIQGALFDGLSCALGEIANIKLDATTRMTEFCYVACAGLKAYGYDPNYVISVLLKNRHETLSDSVLENPFGKAIVAFMDGKDRWEGTASELLKELEGQWPNIELPPWMRTSHCLSQTLGRMDSGLKSLGIQVDRRRSNHQRLIMLSKTPSHTSL